MFKFYFVLIFLAPFYTSLGQQKAVYKVRTIAFYNLENLFDTVNDSLTFDDDRTPMGKDQWTEERYQLKLEHLAQVLSEIGSEVTGTSPDLIGVAEVENEQVLRELIQQPPLANKGYDIVHFDSPDSRGIDVALLYKRAAFTPLSFESRRLLLENEEGERTYTRDQLVVEGLLDEERFFFLVNHWPSRRGGELRSRPFRMEAAKLNKAILDSLQRQNGPVKVIGMGDFNDDPINASFKKVLRTKTKPNAVEALELFNPMEGLYKKGEGSLAYRDQWSLFDQLYCTGSLIHAPETEFHYWKVGIYNPQYLKTTDGPYKGYPWRTYAGGNYTAGYSDHFPVYMMLLKKMEGL